MREAQRLALAAVGAADALKTEAKHAEDLLEALEYAAIGLAEAGLQSDAVVVNARLLFRPAGLAQWCGSWTCLTQRPGSRLSPPPMPRSDRLRNERKSGSDASSVGRLPGARA